MKKKQRRDRELAVQRYLLVLRYPQMAPVRPDSVEGLWPSFAQHRSDGAATGPEVYSVQAVEPHRPAQITGPT